MKKMFNIKHNQKKESYITLDINDIRRIDTESIKLTIHELTSELEDILGKLKEFNLSYEELRYEDVLVLECGDVKLNLETNKISVENVNKELALVALANR